MRSVSRSTAWRGWHHLGFGTFARNFPAHPHSIQDQASHPHLEEPRASLRFTSRLARVSPRCGREAWSGMGWG
jgi:hypothetical protein